MTAIADADLSLQKSGFKLKKGLLPLALLLGLFCGWWSYPPLMDMAKVVSDVFMQLFKLISMPICFLSITATLSGMPSFKALQSMGGRVLQYTLLTTIIAATVALGFFLWIDPVINVREVAATLSPKTSNLPSELLSIAGEKNPLWSFFLKAIPENIIQPFLEGNIIGVMFLALIFSFAVIRLPKETKHRLHLNLKALFETIMQVTQGLIWILPLGIWAISTVFVLQWHEMGPEATDLFKSLGLYLTCIVLANVFQAFVVLPLFLKWHRLSPWKTAKGMLPALFFAFWSKSSSATLPLAIECAEDNLKLRPAIVRFSLPLCTTINMNACAAFILLTVLFVGASAGMTFSLTDQLLWILVATLAAVGNAGVPMGCYFLSTALIAGLNLPITLMAVILPFYAMIDMLETSINVWSDACVTTVLDKTQNLPLNLDE